MNARLSKASSTRAAVSRGPRQSVPLTMRRAAFKLHLWLGLTAGLYFLLISLSGAALVFADDIEACTGPRLDKSRAGERLPYSVIANNVTRRYPAYRLTWIHNSMDPATPIQVFAEAGAHRKTLLVDPCTALVVGEGSAVLQFLRDFHFNLLFGRTGRLANGFGAALLLVMSASGLFLWWRGSNNWTRNLNFSCRGNWRRTVRHGHGALGIWALPAIVMWAASGIYFAFPQQVQSVLNAILSTAETTRSTRLPGIHPAADQPVDLDTLVAVASSHAPGQRAEWIKVPSDSSKPMKVIFALDGDAEGAGVSQVLVDASTSAIVKIVGARPGTTSDTILDWLTRLHFGSFGGVPVKVAWVLLGLAPAMLMITAVIMRLARIGLEGDGERHA